MACVIKQSCNGRGLDVISLWCLFAAAADYAFVFLVQTYHTLQDMRMVFVDGTVLDTADPASRQAFLKVTTAAVPKALI